MCKSKRQDQSEDFAKIPKQVMFAKVSAPARMLWMMVNTYEETYHPTEKDLQDDLCLCSKTIRKLKRELLDANMIRIEKRRGLRDVIYCLDPEQFQ